MQVESVQEHLLLIVLIFIACFVVAHLHKRLLIFRARLTEAPVSSDIFVASPVINHLISDLESFGLIPGLLEFLFLLGISNLFYFPRGSGGASLRIDVGLGPLVHVFGGGGCWVAGLSISELLGISVWERDKVILIEI